MSYQPRRPSLRVETLADVTAVTLTERVLDGEQFQAVVAQLRRLAREAGRDKLYLNFDRVEFLTGSGLGQLVDLHNRLRARGGRLTLYNVHATLYEVFTATRLNELLDVHPCPAAQLA